MIMMNLIRKDWALADYVDPEDEEDRRKIKEKQHQKQYQNLLKQLMLLEKFDILYQKNKQMILLLHAGKYLLLFFYLNSIIFLKGVFVLIFNMLLIFYVVH